MNLSFGVTNWSTCFNYLSLNTYIYKLYSYTTHIYTSVRILYLCMDITPRAPPFGGASKAEIPDSREIE